jgi:hypothetical protein
MPRSTTHLYYSEADIYIYILSQKEQVAGNTQMDDCQFVSVVQCYSSVTHPQRKSVQCYTSVTHPQRNSGAVLHKSSPIRSATVVQCHTSVTHPQRNSGAGLLKKSPIRSATVVQCYTSVTHPQRNSDAVLHKCHPSAAQQWCSVTQIVTHPQRNIGTVCNIYMLTTKVDATKLQMVCKTLEPPRPT